MTIKLAVTNALVKTNLFGAMVLTCLAASTLSAQAAETPCGVWEASVTSLSGEGEALNAHYCSEAPQQVFSFEITCTAANLNIRFMPQPPEGVSFDKVTLDYAIDGKSQLIESQFEELDGAFAVNVDASHPLVDALRSGAKATVSLKKTTMPVYNVPLAGSGRAIAKVIRACR